ncbi:MAG: YceI family protein [Flavobacteriaceae bacterium]|nr:YceI family protein [Flavobacteriaceae bacterium]
MKKLILTMLVAVSVMACKTDSKNKVETSDAKEVEAVKSETISYVVINDKSTLTWKGFKPTESHNGTIAISKGVLSLTDNNLVGGKFKIDMNSIVVLDIPADNEYNGKLVGHLKAPDFFDVEKFSTALFEITAVAKNGDKVNVSGNLTIKGITKNITFPAKVSEANGLVTFKSDLFKIDRTEFGIQYNSGKFFKNLKDKMIDDLVEVSFDVKAKK